MDAVGVLSAAFGRAEQVAELQVGIATRFGTALGVEPGGGLDQRRADRREVAACWFSARQSLINVSPCSFTTPGASLRALR